MQYERDLMIAIQLLSREGGVSYKELEDHFERSYRTVQRYVEQIGLLCEVHSFTRNGEKRFYIDEQDLEESSRIKLPELKLSASEITALMLLMGRGELYEDTDFGAHLEKAFGKIFTIQPEQREQFKALSSLVLAGELQDKEYKGKEDIINDLLHAMVKHKVCTVYYHAFWADQIKSYTMKPLHLFQRDGGLYFFTTLNTYSDIRALAVERIKKIEVTEESFAPPEDFRPRDYLETAFNLHFGEPEDYIIRFTREQARFIKQKRWAREQEFINEGDSVLLKMRTSGYDDVKRWVMSYGQAAEVIEPVRLREEIRGEVEAMMGIYKE